jgi:hypothetical protein
MITASPELLGHESIIEIRRPGRLTIFRLTLFGQLIFELLISSKEDRVELTHSFKFIFKGLGLYHPLNHHLQKLVLVLRMLDHRLHQRRVKIEPKGKGVFRCLH